MDRRHFLLTSLAGALAAPLAAGAQQTGKVYRIGFLSLIPGETLMKAVQERLQKLGCIEGKNLIFDCRSAEGRQERLTELSTGLALASARCADCGTGAFWLFVHDIGRAPLSWTRTPPVEIHRARPGALDWSPAPTCKEKRQLTSPAYVPTVHPSARSMELISTPSLDQRGLHVAHLCPARGG
jgi:hypothetical protein